MFDLEARLSAAASSPDWERQVVRRCAWCGRVADRRGRYRAVRALRAETVVTTDGMCPPCGTAALARIAQRTSSLRPAA